MDWRSSRGGVVGLRAVANSFQPSTSPNNRLIQMGVIADTIVPCWECSLFILIAESSRCGRQCSFDGSFLLGSGATERLGC